jgi:hypothetical protein
MNAAYDDSAAEDSADDLTPEQRRARRLRFELIFTSLGLAFGLFVLPALIYAVGAALLGAYGEKAGLSTFYIDFYGDLADGAGRTWLIAVGPLAVVYLVRAAFIGMRPKHAEPADIDEPRPEPRRQPAARKQTPVRKGPSTRSARVEPRMGSD